MEEAVSSSPTRRGRRLAVMAIALTMLMAVPIMAFAGYKEGHISCYSPYEPRTYSTTTMNWDHSHWLESHGTIFAPSVAALSKKWTSLPRYGDWSVWSEAALSTGGANCVQ